MSILPLLILSLAWPAAAEDASCGLNGAGIKTDASLSKDQACLIYNDLMWLGAMKLGSVGENYKKMFGADQPEEAGQKAYAWVKARTTKVGKRNVTGAYAANLGHASRTKSFNEDHPYGSIVFTDEFFALKSRIQRLAVYVHEARHSDGDAFLKAGNVDEETRPSTSHGFCRTVSLNPQPSGTLGDSGCDPKFNGAYAYQAVFMKNLAEACVQCTDAEKAEAKSNGSAAFFSHHLEVPDYVVPR